MGLKMDKVLSNGVKAPNTYAKIIAVSYEQSQAYDAPEGNIVDVVFYFDKEARDADERGYVERRSYVFPDKAKEKRKDQYDHLKTLDDFSGAEDEQDVIV